MPNEDVTPSDVAETSFASVFELAADARDDGVRAKNRAEQRWFRYEDAGFICLWEPQNRSGTKRISHWWVREERRDEDIGAALLDRAISEARESDADRLDIYVYDSQAVEERGFEPVEGGQALDDAQYYEMALDDE